MTPERKLRVPDDHGVDHKPIFVDEVTLHELLSDAYSSE